MLGHRPTGYPDFDGWPRWSTLVHQQMYIEWIQRAWQGGLRLLVAHAVNNEQLAANTHGVTPFDDMNVAEAELAELKALASRHCEFMAIAETAAEARTIIASGRLAVVPGVEVDAIPAGAGATRTATTRRPPPRSTGSTTSWERATCSPCTWPNAFGGAAIWNNGVYDLRPGTCAATTRP